MSLWSEFCKVVNKQMNGKAEQILDEIKQAGYSYYPGSTNVVPSFHIMSKEESRGAAVSGTASAGLLRKVRIGSNLREAYWACKGNGGPGTTIRSVRQVDRRGRVPGKLKLKDGSYRTEVSGYSGHDFVHEVVSRHK